MRVGSNTKTTTRKQPSFFLFSNQCSTVYGTNTAENDITFSQGVFCKAILIFIGNKGYRIVNDTVFSKMLNSYNWRTHFNVIFLVKLTPEWACLDTAIRDTES